MKKIYNSKIIFAFLLSFIYCELKAQLPYSENFGTACNSSFPGNWTSNDPDWLIDPNSTICTGGVPECTVTGSSGESVMAGANGSFSLEATVSASINASAYTNLTVDWNGYRENSFGTAPTLIFEYSFDNSVFVPVAFTDVATDGQWHAISTINLPPACDNAPKIFFRWSYTGNGTGAFIAIDDVLINGTSLNTFYWNGSGGLHLTTSWGAFPNGTGPNPLSFSAAGQTFNVYNNTGISFSAALTAPWAVSGGSVFVNLGNGTTINTNLTIPSGANILTLTNATLNIQTGSTLTIQNSTFPAANLVSFGPNSTVDFAQSVATNLWPKTYENLTISGGANKSANGSTTINGILNLTNGSSNLVMLNAPLQSLTLNGTAVGTGSLLTGNSRLFIGGTGALGTLRFGTGATASSVNQFNVNRTASGSVILGSNLTVSGSSNLTNGIININGTTLSFNGSVTFHGSSANGSFSGSSTSNISFSGGGALTNSFFMDQSSSSTRTLRNLTLNKTGQTLTIGNALEIRNSIDPTAGTIASGANLTLKSDASAKARIGIIGSGGAFTGTPTVELFKAAGLTNWVNMCSSGVTGQHMSNWNSSFAITCSLCPDGTQVGGVTFTSIYTYDQSTFNGDEADPSHYKEIIQLDPLNAKTGYWVYLGNGFPNTTAITIPLTGGVHTKGSSGAYSLSNSFTASPANGWNLISNPYPSPISVANMLNAIGAASTTIDQTFYVYDSNTDANVPYTASGSNSIIPLGQAFSVRAISTTAITPDETWKTISNSNVGLLKMNASSSYYWDDFLLSLTSASFPYSFVADAYFTFDPSYTTGFDNGKDAYFIGNSVNPGLPIMYSKSNNEKFLRNALPDLNGTVNIPLTITTATAGIFQIKPINLNKLPAGACVKLYDITNAVLHDLKIGPYTATVSANVTTPLYELRITLTPGGTLTSNVNHPLCQKGTNGSVIAKGAATGPWNYTWKDASNNIIKTSLNKNSADTLSNIGVGNFKVDVNTVGSCDNAAATFVLNSTAPLPVSSFATNFDTLNINGSIQFVFTNNSTNADSYFWNFGDGNNSTATSPSYMYANAGAYNVTLNAINSTCADTVLYSRTVYAVSNPTLSGIISYQSNDNSIKVGKDMNGIFVEFAFDKNTKATISVNNILGQSLITPMQVQTISDKFYIDLNAKEQLIFVNVTTTEKRFTQKIFHN